MKAVCVPAACASGESVATTGFQQRSKGRSGSGKASAVCRGGMVEVKWKASFRSTKLGGCCHREAGGRLTGSQASPMASVEGTFGFSSWS